MERALRGNWGNRTADDFQYQIAFQFVEQLKDAMKAAPMDRAQLAKKIGVSKGRVSQILNDPGNLTLKLVVRWARALDLKVAIVAYEDPRDPENDSGPVNPLVFVKCWEKAERPTDLFAAGMASASTQTIEYREDATVPAEALQEEIAETLGNIDPRVWQTIEKLGEMYAGTGSA